MSFQRFWTKFQKFSTNPVTHIFESKNSDFFPILYPSFCKTKNYTSNRFKQKQYYKLKNAIARVVCSNFQKLTYEREYSNSEYPHLWIFFSNQWLLFIAESEAQKIQTISRHLLYFRDFCHTSRNFWDYLTFSGFSESVDLNSAQ